MRIRRRGDYFGFWEGGLDAYEEAANSAQSARLQALQQQKRDCSTQAERDAVQAELTAFQAEVQKERNRRRFLIF